MCRTPFRLSATAGVFLATLASTTFVGRTTPDWTSGLWYSLPILTILTAHEFGHYIACRIHNVDATLPYYIPAPFLPLTGTLGAVTPTYLRPIAFSWLSTAGLAAAPTRKASTVL